MNNSEMKPFDTQATATILQAELPVSLDSLSAILEQTETRPAHEIGVYTFTQPTHLLLCRYPAITREYLDLYHEDPEKLTIAFSKKSDETRPSLRIGLQTNHSVIEFVSNDDPQSYTMRITTDTADILNYQCTSDEIGSLLLSATLSPNHAEDVARSEAESGSKSINPTDPHIYPLMRNSLEANAQDYSYRRGYQFALDEVTSLHLQATSHTMEGTSINAELTQSYEDAYVMISASVARSHKDADGTLKTSGERLDLSTGDLESIDSASCQAMFIAACEMAAEKQLG